MNYILEILLDKPCLSIPKGNRWSKKVQGKDVQIRIGSLGRINFKKGVYLYIGSAKKNLKPRIERHLVKKKKRFWHIDYLLYSNDAKVKQVWITDKIKECNIAQFLFKKGYSFIDRFGSSDCNCPSHLFFINKGAKKVQDLLKKEGFVKYADKNTF